MSETGYGKKVTRVGIQALKFRAKSVIKLYMKPKPNPVPDVATQSATDPVHAPLKPPTPAHVQALVKGLNARHGLTLADSGWVAALDAALASEPSLAPAALELRAANLSPRWADIYVQDIRAALGSMEGDIRYFQDLNYRLASQTIDLHALDDALRIHELEVQAGYYTVASEVAAREVAAAEQQQAGVIDAVAAYERLFLDPDVANAFNDPEQAANKRAKVATILTYAPYSMVHNQYKTGGFLTWPDGTNANAGVPVPFDPAAGNVAPDLMPTPAIVHGLTRTAALCEIASAAVLTTTGQIFARSGQQAGVAAVAGRRRQADWALADVGFRRARTQSQIDARELRRQAAEPAGGPMNIAEKCRGLRRRFIEQLAETLSRSLTVVAALRPVFGLPMDVPPPLPHDWDDTQGRYLEALQAWFVNLDSALARAQQGELAQVITVSVKLASGAAFAQAQAALKAGNASSLSVVWTLDPTLLSGVSGARLRGLSISTIETAPDPADSWSGRITPPQRAQSIDAQGRRHALTQPIVPIQAGRISSRAAMRPADVLGQASARHLSPIGDDAQLDASGKWLLEIFPKSLLGHHAYDLKDLVVELLVSGVEAGTSVPVIR
jgi:hypothetical protein